MRLDVQPGLDPNAATTIDFNSMLAADGGAIAMTGGERQHGARPASPLAAPGVHVGETVRGQCGCVTFLLDCENRKIALTIG